MCPKVTHDKVAVAALTPSPLAAAPEALQKSLNRLYVELNGIAYRHCFLYITDAYGESPASSYPLVFRHVRSFSSSSFVLSFIVISLHVLRRNDLNRFVMADRHKRKEAICDSENTIFIFRYGNLRNCNVRFQHRKLQCSFS